MKMHGFIVLSLVVSKPIAEFKQIFTATVQKFELTSLLIDFDKRNHLPS